jgi:hypothetical protein
MNLERKHPERRIEDLTDEELEALINELEALRGIEVASLYYARSLPSLSATLERFLSNCGA